MDIYQPSGDTMTARPLIIWAHGGSFLAGSKNDNDVTILCQRFAKRGYVCVSIDYRLGIPFPINEVSATKAVYRATQDLRAAVRFFRKDAATVNDYKIDPSIIFAGGSSAGAFTALHLAYLDEVSEIPSAVDTTDLGGLEGSSGNLGYTSTVNAVIDLCGALGERTYIHPGDIPFVALHGTNDNTVPYGTAMIYLLGAFPIMVIDGSYSIAGYADTIGVYNQMYTYYGADHVPYATSTAYMDTTVKFVSNFLFSYFGCTPSDPSPAANTFTTGLNSLANDETLLIFPNPASESLSITSEKNIESITITDRTGKLIKTISDSGKDLNLDITYLEPGMYLLKIKYSGSFSCRKLFVR
jgi:para-nitrobenzyl esterase